MKSLSIFFLFFMFLIHFETAESKNSQNPQARTLIYPPTTPTRVQFIGGIGIPVEDLLHEAVTSGYVLKAEYFLPTKSEEFTRIYLKPQTIHRRNAATQPTQMKNGSSIFDSNFESQQNHASTYRWTVYKAIEVAINSSGLPGRTCILRSICEHAKASLHYGNGILAELLHIILTPSTSHDKLSNISDRSYLEAERFGRLNRNCAEIYKDCPKPPIDLITTVFDFDNL